MDDHLERTREFFARARRSAGTHTSRTTSRVYAAAAAELPRPPDTRRRRPRMRHRPRLARAAPRRGRRRDDHRRRRDAGDAGRGRGRRSAGTPARSSSPTWTRSPCGPRRSTRSSPPDILGHVPDPTRLLRTLASFATPGRPPRGVPSDRARRARRRATNERCSRTSCSIRRSCPACSRGRAGRSRRSTTANRATSRSRVAPSR